jgi:hypothetical protein
MKCVSRDEKHGYPWLHDEVSFEASVVIFWEAALYRVSTLV